MPLPTSTKLKNLKANPDNPRTITPEKLEMLKKALAEYGDLGGFVFKRKTKRLIGGHQRMKVMPQDADVTIERTYKNPTRTGTVAEGFVVFEGERFSYREVDWPAAKEKAANIAANKGAGEWDYAVLGQWMRELSGLEFDLGLTMFDENERKGFFSGIWEDADGTNALAGAAILEPEVVNRYTKKIQPPIYEPKGEKPEPSELFDTTKTSELLSQIEKAKIPDDIKTFLRAAAHRHTIFNYEKVAEFYAHASKEIQALMENSALVIIDFKKAIENGFVILTKDLAEICGSAEAKEL